MPVLLYKSIHDHPSSLKVMRDVNIDMYNINIQFNMRLLFSQFNNVSSFIIEERKHSFYHLKPEQSIDGGGAGAAFPILHFKPKILSTVSRARQSSI